MAKLLRQSTASQEIAIGRMLDSVDGDTEKTALSIANTDIKVWKNGTTTFASKNSGGATHQANGLYTAVLDATDTNTVGPLKVYVHVSGALSWEDSYNVLPANVYDALTGADLLDVNTSQFGNTDGTFASGIPAASLTTAAINAVADQVFDEALSGHRTIGSFGASIQPIDDGTAQSGGSTTIQLKTGSVATDDYYNNVICQIIAGTGIGQARFVSDYTGATKTATVNSAWVVNPDNTSVYVLKAFSTVPGASAPTAAEVADAVCDEILSGHTTAGSVGQALGGMVLQTGTAQTGTGSSITLATSASTTADLYNRDTIAIVAGTGAGQSSQITDYSTGRVATVDPAWSVAPDNTSVYIVSPLGIDAATIAAISSGVWAATRAANNSAGTFGEYVNADGVRLAGSTTAAANAKSFFDGTGYAGTNNVIPLVTTVTGNVNGSVGGSVGSVAGSVGGSVVGSVASVTGNVGGNVVGSVASVAGNVGGSVASVTAGVTLAANAVSTTSVADGTITAAKIASNAITNAKIEDGALTAAKCGDNLPVSVESINGVAVTGDGSSGDKFDVS